MLHFKDRFIGKEKRGFHFDDYFIHRIETADVKFDVGREEVTSN